MNNHTISGFSPQINKLIKLLGSMNPTLADIVIGIEKVIYDIDNPDRFRQAANSIRGITDILIRNIEISNSKRHLNLEQKEILKQLKKCFKQALRLMPTSSEKNERGNEKNRVKQQYKELEESLKKGRFTQKQKLTNYFGSPGELSKLPESIVKDIRKVISIWAETYDYFVKLSHYDAGSIKENIFKEKWLLIQDCLIRALSPFFEEIPILDEFLNLEIPPNE